MIVYLDTLALMFRAYYAIPDLTSDDNTPTGALYGLTNTLFRIIGELEPDHIIACFDRPEETLRQKADESYKSNRHTPEEDMAVQIELAKEVLISYGVHIVEKAGYEADDLLGTLASQDAKNGEDVVIVSCDGDILQLTTQKNIRVYFLRKGMSDFILYDEKEVNKKNGYPAKYIVDYKGLAGDSSDNISGVSGIGATFASRLINKHGNLEDIYAALDSGKLEGEFIPRVQKLLIEGRESAFSSRDLATIQTNVPVSPRHLQSKIWQENIVFLNAKNTLEKYNFTSLIKKLSIITGSEDGFDKDVISEDVDSSIEIDPKKEREAAIMLWIHDSAQTNATAEEVLAYTQKSTLEESIDVLMKKIKEDKCLSVWEDIEKPLIPIIEKIQNIGIRLNKKSIERLSKKYHKKIDDLRKQIYKYAGVEFNINSPKQLGEILFDVLKLVPKSSKKTASGSRTTKEAVLITLADEHPIIPLILDYRHFEKLRSTYVDAFPTFLDKNDRIHTELLQNGTTTGRFSSRNPNLQNIPAGGEDGKDIRDLFIPEEGKEMFTIDYSQMELRIAAVLSKEKTLLDAFYRGADIHRAVAARMFNIGEDAVTKYQRNQAKGINFGILYGMGVSSLQKSFDVTREEAQIFLDQYKKNFSKIFEYMDSIKKRARETGGTQTAFGRMRSIEGITSSLAFVRAQAERMAVNSVIQGTAADIIKKAMIEIDNMIEGEKYDNHVKMILQIHDELLFEIDPGFFDTVVPVLVDIMEGIYPKNKDPIPLSVDVRRGTSWGSLNSF